MSSRFHSFALGLLLVCMAAAGHVEAATIDWSGLAHAVALNPDGVVRDTTAEVDRARARNDKQALLTALRRRAFAHQWRRDYANLDSDAQLALPLARELSDLEAQCELMGYHAMAVGDHNSAQALALIGEAIALAEKSKLPVSAGLLSSTQGGLYDRFGHKSDALASYQKAYALLEAENVTDELPAILVAMAMIYSRDPSDRPQTDRAVGYLQRVLQLQAHPVDRSKALSRLAWIYAQRGEFADARKYYDESLKLLPQAEPFDPRDSVLLRILWHERKWTDALSILERARAHFASLNETANGARVNLQRAEVFVELGRKAEALAALQSARNVLFKGELSVEAVGYLTTAATIHAALGDHAQAYEDMLALRATERRFLEIESAKRSDELHVRFNVQLKDKENALLKAEQQAAQTQKLVMVLGLALSVALLVGATLFLRKRASKARAEAAHNKGLAAIEVRRAQDLQAANATLKRLAAFGQEIAAQLDAERIHRSLCDDLAQLVETDSASVWMMEGEQLVQRLCLPDGAQALAEVPLHGEDSEIARCARQRQALVDDGASTGASSMCVPLMAGGVVLGVLELRAARPGAYPEQAQQVVLTLAAYGAVALANASNAQRLSAASQAKSWFLANMSHELRTPLNAILGYAQLLQWDKGLGERHQKELGTIRKSGEHLLALIEDVLDVARIESGKFELFSAAASLKSFLSVVSDIARVRAEGKGVRFVQELAPDLPSIVLVDEKRLRQVLLNLLGNAVKFTDAGEVRLRVTVMAADVQKVRLRFEIHDTGPGIAHDQLELIFQPFEQVGEVSRRASGTGLGLTISRQLVRLMGGDIRVDSTLGRGSCFSFELETLLPEQQPAVHKEQYTDVVGYAGPRRRVLVVDDVRENRELMTDMLGRLGFEVLTASNGEEGLEMVRSTQPDLMLIDSVMPVLDGTQTLRRLRATPEMESLPVISVSAGASTDDRERCLGAGADAFLTKPVDFPSLLRQMQTLLRLQWTHE